MDEMQVLRLRCACGWETTGTEDELVVAATEHGRRIHNMTPTRDEVLEMLVPSADHQAQPRHAEDHTARP